MNPWIDVAGWTLVHFVWQGAGLAALAAAALWLMRERSPQARYLVGCVTLAAMLAAPLVTAAVLSQSLAVAWSAPPAAAPLAGADVDAVPDGAAMLLNLSMARGLSSVDVATPSLGAWLAAIVGVWMAGVAVLLMRLLGGWWRIHRLHRIARATTSSTWAHATARIAAALGVSARVHVVDSSLVDTPTVIGWMKPVILLPVAALAGLSPSQVEAILAHELAHIRRHDFLVNLLQTCAETMLFYHPAVWWLSSRIRIEREHCCDLVALSVCGDAVSYADALVELESWRTTHSRLAVAATGGGLTTRVRRLLGAPADKRPRSLGVATIAGVVALLCIGGTSAYVLAVQPDAASEQKLGSGADPAAWSMVFNHEDSTMRFIGFRGRDLVRFAYQVPTARVVGGPQWLDEQILRLVINLGAAPRADEMPRIAREALESRLQMKAHIEKRNFPVLALVKARADGALGPGIRASTQPCFDIATWIADGQPADRVAQRRGVPACGEETDTPLGQTHYASISMPQFAEQLRGYLWGWRMGPRELSPRPLLGPQLVEIGTPEVVDRTGLSGRYDIALSAFYPTAALMSRFPFLTHAFESIGFTSIPRALSSQLGLALVESEAPYDVVVIDQVERP